MKIKKIILELLISSIVILFVYTPTSKLLKVQEYILAMKAQPLLPWFQQFLIYAVPTSEYLVVILLAIPKYRKIGLNLSLVLLILFTGYISLIQLNYYGRIPCSCGGVIRSMNWYEHLIFNVFFIFINILSIWLNKQIHKVENVNQSYKLSA
ncbi:MauE/DoxX family redox-associated membrane protein [Chitinophaga sp. 30R24]|uniref:MauE/DoxX family redox-associated membrane protein n=1 Tax=Chitinophaga sp. 30R24 TaxID=3248838 RepID=UPI003B8F9F4B